MELDSWLDKQIKGSGEGGASYRERIYLDNAGPVSRMLRESLGSEQHTSSLVAAAFWQSFVQTPTFRELLMYHGWSTIRRNEGSGGPSSGMFVVPLSDGSFGLLVQSNGYSDRDPVVLRAEAPRRELISGWGDFREEFSRRIRARESSGHNAWPSSLLLDNSAHAAAEASNVAAFWMVLTGPWSESLTNVPSPGLRVQSGTVSSAVGASVQDSLHRKGYTAAFHAVDKGTAITIDGNSAVYIEGDSLTDSCFLEVGGVTRSMRSTHGPLKLAPRPHQVGTFEGVATSSGTARVVAWSYELPYVDPNLQPTVRTDLVTAPGDSGAALLDPDGYILGFAHSRSGFGVPVTYSTWIWADAVFQKLGLTIY